MPQLCATGDGEGVDKAIDNNITSKYLNFCQWGTGFQVIPVYGPSVISAISMTTANDVPGRDPKTWEIYGSNDDSNDVLATFSLISKGEFLVDATRFSKQTVTFTNSVPYKMYKVIFPNVVQTSCITGEIEECNSMHVDEVGLLTYN